MKQNLTTLQEATKHKDGTYVSLELDAISQGLLDHFVEMNLGLTERIDPSTYHITVIYSRTPVPRAEVLQGVADVDAYATGYEVFPTKDGNKCLVLRVASKAAEQLNSYLGTLGATSDYDDYKAHITICYDYKGPENINSLPVPQFALHFDRLNVAPLDPQFTPANK
jgi:2'-5' RNA ligase